MPKWLLQNLYKNEFPTIICIVKKIFDICCMDSDSESAVGDRALRVYSIVLSFSSTRKRENFNPLMASDIRKPSEFIRYRQAKNCRVYTGNNLPLSSVVELIRNSDIEIQQCQVPLDQSLFRPEPSNIILEGFIPFKTYELIVNFRNMDHVL
jgi:hypothetical protein